LFHECWSAFSSCLCQHCLLRWRTSPYYKHMGYAVTGDCSHGSPKPFSPAALLLHCPVLHSIEKLWWSTWVTWIRHSGLSAWWLMQILVEACHWSVSWLWVETVRSQSLDFHSSCSVLWWCYRMLLPVERHVERWQLASAEWWVNVLFSAGVQDVDASDFGVIILIPDFLLNLIWSSTAGICISNSWYVAFRLCQVISTFHHVTYISTELTVLGLLVNH
jgi:hypothetical protein